MSIIMSGHPTCKNEHRMKKKSSWAWKCIFSSNTKQKWMKNIWINILEDFFWNFLIIWSRYRSEEISPPPPLSVTKIQNWLQPCLQQAERHSLYLYSLCWHYLATVIAELKLFLACPKTEKKCIQKLYGVPLPL